MFEKRFGEGALLFDQGDLGANREATAAGRIVVPRGALTPEMRKNVLTAGIQKAGDGSQPPFMAATR